MRDAAGAGAYRSLPQRGAAWGVGTLWASGSTHQRAHSRAVCQPEACRLCLWRAVGQPRVPPSLLPRARHSEMYIYIPKCCFEEVGVYFLTYNGNGVLREKHIKKRAFKNVEIPTFQFLIKSQIFGLVLIKKKICIILAKNTRRLSH